MWTRVLRSRALRVRVAGFPALAAAAKSVSPALAERAPAAASAGEAKADVFAKLERLAALHAKGILSDAEFEAKKTELLARI